MPNIPILSFNNGEVSSQIDARSDVDKYGSSCRHLHNMLPLVYGSAERRPGFKYIDDATNTPVSIANTTVRQVPFIFSASIAYTIELGNRYAKFYYNSAALDDSGDVWISTPYLATDLLELQFQQRADVMWITHPSYPPSKIKRIGVKTFTLTEIDFRKGPFLIRNDLIDPDNPSTTTLTASTTSVGSSGTLTATTEVFLPGHKGALFMLIHKIDTTIVKLKTAGTSDPLLIKGDFAFNTHGRWAGTVKLQRNENSSEWEDYRTWIGDNDRNVQLAGTESEDNVEYRIVIEGTTTCKADLTVNSVLRKGIVKVTAILTPYKAAMEVYATIESTGATKRWHEGAWSTSRGYPASVTFYNDRCVYAGSSRSLEDSEYGTSEYPSLRI